MIRIVSIFALVLFAAALAFGKPTNPNAAKPAPAPIKSPSDLGIERIRSMEGPTNWGWLCADGRNFTLEGHIRWKASGYVRSDGVIVIMWTDITDDCLAPGTYRLHDKGLVGEWGHSHESRIGDDGKLEGVRRGDMLVNVLPVQVRRVNRGIQVLKDTNDVLHLPLNSLPNVLNRRFAMIGRQPMNLRCARDIVRN